MQSVTLDHVAPQLRDELLKSVGDERSDGYVVVSAPAHPVALDGVLQAGGEQAASVWATPDGREFAGVGVAAEVFAASEQRFEQVQREVSQILGRVNQLDPSAPKPRMFGGFSFSPGRSQSSLWTGFGEAHFVLPRISCHRTEHGGWVSLTVRHDELKQPDVVTDLVQKTARWLARLGRQRAASDSVSSMAFRVSDAPGLEDWTRLVEEIQHEISQGHFDKAVLARRAIYELRPPPSPTEVLERLRHSATDCTRFAVQRGGHVFLGATPEWLIRKRGPRIETEAMAGSSPRGDSLAEKRLLCSAKDLEEHRLVLEEVVRVLEPLCTELSVPAGPRIRRLKDLLHLQTPVVGQLANEHHIVDLVGRLHPTPAVGGVPRDAALAWLGDHETESRGWYASPVGWVDANGDGEFAVALRSALMIDNVAHLFAGAGIVKDSNPNLEYEETQLKLASMVRALGVV